MQESNIKILIVDDIEDNRLVIKKICKKLQDVELLEAANGVEAINMTRQHHPRIILMDVMMPVMDGFEASTIIKSEFPETSIIVVTALTDEETEKNFLKLGIDGYLRKPLARGILKVKLEGLLATIKIKNGTSSILSTKHTLNPFNKNIRKMKTLFDIENEDDIMNLGLWLTDYYGKRNAVTTMSFDFSLDFTYQFLKEQIRIGNYVSVVAEEDFDDVYLNFVLKHGAPKESYDLNIEEKIQENIVYKNGILHLKIKMKYDYQPEALMAEDLINSVLANAEYSGNSLGNFDQQPQYYTHDEFEEKISAKDFVRSLEPEVLKSLKSLEHVEERFASLLDKLESTKSADLLERIGDEAIAPYAYAINKIYEFHTLGYGISTLAVFLKTTDPSIAMQNIVRIHSILFSIYQDLTCWRREVFIDKCTDDIHHFDSSLLCSCIQIDSAIKLKPEDNE